MPTRRNRTGKAAPPRKTASQHAKDVENEFRAQYGVSRAVDYAHGRAAQAEAARTMPPEEAAALLRARSGDDSGLFPYTPTPSINPPRPRTQGIGYSRETNTMRIKFRDGAVYEYYDVPENAWRNIRRVKSPGRFINRTLNNYAYARRQDLEA